MLHSHIFLQDRIRICSSVPLQFGLKVAQAQGISDFPFNLLSDVHCKCIDHLHPLPRSPQDAPLHFRLHREVLSSHVWPWGPGGQSQWVIRVGKPQQTKQHTSHLGAGEHCSPLANGANNCLNSFNTMVKANQVKHIGTPAPSVEKVVYKMLLKSSICFW